MEPRFLTLGQVVELHCEAIAAYGGSAGVRDRGMLESALAMPRAAFGGQYVHEDLAATAAAYVFHLVMNHPFVDGNKRVGALVGFVFLDLNGVDFNAPEDEFEATVLAVAKGEADKDSVAAFFRKYIES